VSYTPKTASSNGYTYQYVENDPSNTRIYELDNGLKVYLSVYKNEPRIQTNIAVKAGGKNDPNHATGLAHYLEHIMFKGTSAFGTQDWEKESVLLDSIENMFEYYRTLKDAEERKKYYQQIDKVSNEAAQLAIANEYDKMLSMIGAKGTNAYTSVEQTVYINDIPANEIERWLEIEANRFSEIVARLFHTELEAVYEEKNRALDSDGRKTYETLFSNLFPTHTYGTQSVLGTIEHLKNPSIKEIKKYFGQYYVPNNMAICLSGDLDPDKTIKLIDKYFGGMKKGDVPGFDPPVEDSIKAPIVKEVLGPDADQVTLGFRFPGNSDESSFTLELLDMMLSNSQAGLMDLNLKQKQKVLFPYSYTRRMNDYSVHVLSARPREGQSMEEVRDLLLEQIELIKKGEFDDWLLDAVITDLELNEMRYLESNRMRAGQLVSAFIQEKEWSDYLNRINKLKKITKQEVIDFAKANYNDNYVQVNKKSGEDPNKQQIDKPSITQVDVNREAQSEFLLNITKQDVPRLSPVFLDYQKDLEQAELVKGVNIIHKKNEENGLFELYYKLDIGSDNNPKLKLAVEYLEYLGTETLSAEELKKEMYKLGCSFRVYAGSSTVYVTLEGLASNMEAAMVLFEDLLNNPKADDEALQKMIEGIIKKRADAKKNKFSILYSGLMSYAQYGSQSSFTNVLNNDQLKELKASELIDVIKGFTKYEHKVLYYGPSSMSELQAALKANHKVPETLTPQPERVKFPQLDNKESKVYWANYDMVQAEIMFVSKGQTYNKELTPASRMFNEYFGGGMGSIVFQEMREARALAYSVWSRYREAPESERSNYLTAYIGTQADKLPEAMKGMLELLNDIPKSEKAFQTAKDALLSQLESERITKADIIFNYEGAKRKELEYDIRKDVYAKAKDMTFEDVSKFHQDHVKDRTYTIVVVGSKDKLDFNTLKKYGEVQELSLEELFGY